MDFLKLPFFREIEPAQTILLAGCGGGYDIYCGLPLYFGLRAAGKTVHLANLSFASVFAPTGRKLPGGLVEHAPTDVQQSEHCVVLDFGRD